MQDPDFLFSVLAMVVKKNGGNVIRYQSAFISDNEVNKLISEIKRSQAVESM